MLRVDLETRLGAQTLTARFALPPAGISGLFGASGSGKTSILRAIAGLARPDRALISLGDTPWQDDALFLPPERRGVGMVFQAAGLFPHLDVAGTLAFAARRAPPGPIAAQRVTEMLALTPLLHRRIPHLSGGERQRVAIGRALLAQPRLLLLDEPVSALDHGARDEILAALERLADELQLPMLYVSHNLAEMAAITDHLLLLDQGRVLASAATPRLLTDLTQPLASRPDALSVLQARVEDYDPAEGVSTLVIEGHFWQIPGRIAPGRSHCRVRVMASDVGLARAIPAESSILNTPLATILAATPMESSGQIKVLLSLGEDQSGQRILARISRKSWAALEFHPGEQVHLRIKGVGLVEVD